VNPYLADKCYHRLDSSFQRPSFGRGGSKSNSQGFMASHEANGVFLTDLGFAHGTHPGLSS